MAGSTITGFYSGTIYLGQGNYPSPLTISSSGFVNPEAYGADAVYAASTISNPLVTNHGTIWGGYGGSANLRGFAVAGGDGVDLRANGAVDNYGKITGGTGGGGYGASGYYGGNGVDLTAGGSVFNSGNGTITGGAGGYGGSGYGGGGGVGVDIASGGSVFNEGTILGGAGGAGFNGDTGTEYGGSGGNGVMLGAGDYLYTTGLIEGGRPGGITGADGGAGVSMAAGAIVNNDGTIIGGGTGGFSGSGAEPGGIGIFAAAAAVQVVNSGDILGGKGAYQGGSLTPSGGAGGTAVYFRDGGTLTNDHIIYGGDAGASNSAGDTGGTGGIGVLLETGGTITNSGVIEGGIGGTNYWNPGLGGVGIKLDSGGIVTNFGTIEGGMGGYGDVGGYGGTGVYLNGGTLTNAGIIDGGSGGISNGGSGNPFASGEAVQFGATAATLVVDPGAVFNGNVVANEAAADHLTLAGTTAGIIDGLGSQFAGFKYVTVNAGAAWTLTGLSDSAASNQVLTIAGALTLGDTAVDGGAANFADAGKIAVNGHGSLQLAGIAQLQVDTLTLSGGTLNCGSQTKFVVGPNADVGVQGALMVASGATLKGYGTIASTLVYDGTVAVTAGKLLVTGDMSGAGTLSAAKGAILDLTGGAMIGGPISGAGTVRFDSATTLDSGTKLLASSIIDTASLTLGSATTITNAAGHAFTLSAAAGATVTVSGAANDSFTNAGSLTCSGAGTEHVSIALINSATLTETAGKFSFLGSATNNGTINATGGVLSFSAKLGGTGTLDIGAAGKLSLLAGSSAGQTVDFLGSGGLLSLTQPLQFGGLIEGFGGSDKIDLVNTPATSLGYAGGVLTVKNGTTTEATLHFSGSYTPADFAIGTDSHGGSIITFV